MHYFEDKQAFVVGTGYNELSFDDYGKEELAEEPLLKEEKAQEMPNKRIKTKNSKKLKQLKTTTTIMLKKRKLCKCKK